MRKQSWLIGLILTAIVLSLAACGGAAVALTPTPTVANSSANADYWSLVQQAQNAYVAANYADALKLAQQAIAVNPTDPTALELYRQTAVAQAGDDYLTNLPPHRYRLPVDVFVRDEVNHSKDWFIVDVREPDEFAKGHIDGAINIPLHELMKHLDELPNSKTAPILFYCHTQKRSTHAVVIMHELGYSKAFHLEGGYAAYEDWMSNNVVPTPGPTPTPGPEEPDFGC